MMPRLAPAKKSSKFGEVEMENSEGKIIYSNGQWNVVECDFGIFMHPHGRYWYQVPIHVFNEDGMDHISHISKKRWCEINELEDVVRFLIKNHFVTPNYDVDARFLMAKSRKE